MKKICLLVICILMFTWYAHSQLLPGVTVAGGNGKGSAANQLFTPDGVAVDPLGNIYVSDYNNNRVQKWSPGALAGVTVAGFNGAGGTAEKLFEPAGIALDAAGNLYIADEANARIQKWTPDATSGITVAGGNGFGSAANQFNTSYGVCVDASGNIYVADYFNNRVQKWAPGASSGVTVAGGNGFGSASNQFAFVIDVAVDLAGNVYALDIINQRVQKWAPGATSGITVAGGNGAGPAANQLDSPYRIFVDASGNIYITDRGNFRIQKWAPGASSGVTVAAGNGMGSGPNQLLNPNGIFVDTKGSIYVADADNHRVQKFGVIDTLASCPANISLTIPSCNGSVSVTWPLPHDTFPGSIDIPAQLDPFGGSLSFIGTFDGHGYYRSNNTYMWPVAMDISRFIGGTDASGHLATITSAAENTFIFNKVKNSGYSPWIGLFNTGTPGVFRWTNGEDFVYNNWAAGEPNNVGGSTKKVREPYVRLMDGAGTWNDQRSDNVPFIAEFDKPLLRYSQISGPANGSNLGVGVYTVCYERTDLITDKKDTCCFSITISCKSTLAGNTIDQRSITGSSPEDISKGLRVMTAPNPSSNFFSLQLSGVNNTEKVNVQLTDITGKIVESASAAAANQTLIVGEKLRPGVYFAQVTQGSKKVVVKLIKNQ